MSTPLPEQDYQNELPEEPNGRGPVADEDDATRRALTWALRGRRPHRFGYGDELWCRYCGGARNDPQHQDRTERLP